MFVDWIDNKYLFLGSSPPLSWPFIQIMNDIGMEVDKDVGMEAEGNARWDNTPNYFVKEVIKGSYESDV